MEWKKLTKSQVVHAHAQIPSIKKGIESLVAFTNELEALHKKMKDDLVRLGDTHQDQNFAEYVAVFEQFWPTLKEFVKKNNDYIAYLQGRIKFIEDKWSTIKF